MSPTEEILAMAPAIVRTYAVSFLLLPFNIFSTYYFQEIMKPKAAFVVSVARGLVISGILILLLPVVVSADALWLAMPVTELLVICGMEDPDVYGCAAGGEKRVKPERVFGVFPAGFHKKIVL